MSPINQQLNHFPSHLSFYFKALTSLAVTSCCRIWISPSLLPLLPPVVSQPRALSRTGSHRRIMLRHILSLPARQMSMHLGVISIWCTLVLRCSTHLRRSLKALRTRHRCVLSHSRLSTKLHCSNRPLVLTCLAHRHRGTAMYVIIHRAMETTVKSLTPRLLPSTHRPGMLLKGLFKTVT